LIKSCKRVSSALIGAAIISSIVFSSATHSNSAVAHARRQKGFFTRVATFKVNGASAEIVAATVDGRTLIYTNASDGNIGFVDITNPASPVEAEAMDVGGDPTSVATTPDGRWALVVVSASPDKLLVIDLKDRTVETTINLGGQPDSITVSRDGRYAAIAIENERDEDVDDGRMPQAPAGFLTIVDLVGPPARWKTRDVALTGLAQRFPEDPEPEFIDINSSNQAAVTLQENNHVVIVNLKDGRIAAHWAAGTTSHAADTVDDGDIKFTDQIAEARREPDAVAWTPRGRLIVANEGDYTVDLADGEFAGSRDFTVFTASGAVVYEPGVSLELAAANAGHYDDGRSDAKGVEPEGAEIGVFDGRPFAFIGSERGDFIAVYDISDEREPELRQILPTGDEPEGLLAIPRRDLFVTANEADGTLSIFAFKPGLEKPDYPHIISDGLAWSAISGLALGADQTLYAVPDSVFRPSRIFTISTGKPLRIESSLSLGKNYDLEGIAIRPEGGWWVVSEGAGSAGQSNATKNLLVRVNADGSIAAEIELPASVNAGQVQFGFEGVAVSGDGSQVFVAFQREWANDPPRKVKIGQYTVATGEWRFFHYPIDAAPAVEGAWVGLSELVRVNDTTFAALERDNQKLNNSLVKRIYSFSIAGLTPAPAGETPPTVTKTLVRDLLRQDGFLLEKAEGMALTPLGDYIVASDNDGGGETQVLRVLNQNFDVCLQDDHSGDLLRFNSSTGDYLFVRCGDEGFTLSGRGSVRRVGCLLILSDSRVSVALFDCASGSARSGVAIIKRGIHGPPILINDRDIDDNDCDCH
jgi:DNA-binding beta-propeller fold protein YncE